MTQHMRSTVCVVCDQTFTYEYKGGRDRKTCSKSCKRARNTNNKRKDRDRARPRPSGYTPDDYPYELQTTPAAELKAIRSYAEHTRYTHNLKRQPYGVAVDSWSAQNDNWSPLLRRSVGNDPNAEELPGAKNALLRAGHGYVMDDVRTPDPEPLRYYRPKDRGAVRYWHNTSGFPLAGAWGMLAPKRGEVRQYVIGDDGTRPVGSVPRRITRRFCSENALPALAPFSRRFFSTRMEGNELATLPKAA